MIRVDVGDYAEDLTEKRIRALVDDPNYEPVFPWLAGCARYADPDALARRALVAFLSASPRHQRAVTGLIMSRAGRADRADARAGFIAELECPDRDDAPLAEADPETIARFGGIEVCRRLDEQVRVNRLGSKAAGYLAARGYNLAAIMDLAAALTGCPEESVDRLLEMLGTSTVASPGKAS